MKIRCGECKYRIQLAENYPCRACKIRWIGDPTKFEPINSIDWQSRAEKAEMERETTIIQQEDDFVVCQKCRSILPPQILKF